MHLFNTAYDDNDDDNDGDNDGVVIAIVVFTPQSNIYLAHLPIF